jgi:uncharacterized protein YoxC
MDWSNFEFWAVALTVLTEAVLIIIFFVKMSSRVDVAEKALTELKKVSGGLQNRAQLLETESSNHSHRISEKKEALTTLQIKMDAIDSKVITELNRLGEAIARVEGYLSAAKYARSATTVTKKRSGH